VVTGRLLLVVLGLLAASSTAEVGLPALVPPSGMRLVVSTPGLASAHVPSAGGGRAAVADQQPLFPDVPPGGYPHDTYLWGNCTWWVAFNRPVPPYLGDGWQWLASAAAHGMPISSQPAVTAIVVYRASPGYDTVHGHVAIVIAVGAASFRVSEMNYLGLGVVDERDSAWPDWHVQGFILR
jgi:surface antigen